MIITTERVQQLLDEALEESVEEVDKSNAITEHTSRVFNMGAKVMFDSILLKIIRMEMEGMIK